MSYNLLTNFLQTSFDLFSNISQTSFKLNSSFLKNFFQTFLQTFSAFLWIISQPLYKPNLGRNNLPEELSYILS